MTESENHTIVIGVTGGIGSGKSTVCQMMEEEGASVFYADDVARALMTSDPDVKKALIQAFGPSAFKEDGHLNRSYLAERVFSSVEDRKKMNAIVHPAVGEAFAAFLVGARRELAKLVVKEAALLFETDTSQLDHILVVDAPSQLRIERVMARDGATEDQVIARMNAQMPSSHMISLADHVIQNDGSVSTLREKVRAFVSTISSNGAE